MNKGSFARTVTLARRNALEILRDPLSFAFLLGMPLLMEVLFYYLFHKMTAQFEMKYLAPGIVVFAQAFLALFSGILISTDRNTAFLTRLYVSRARASEFVLAYTLALLPITLLQSSLFFVVGGILDPSVWSVRMIPAVFVSLIPAVLFIGFGILIGSLCSERSVGGVASVVIAGQSVLSGMWFPTEGLDGGILTVMKILPFWNASDLVRGVALGEGGFDPAPLCIVLAYAAAIYAIGVVVFGRKMSAR
ncbi:MAG: ABC transporter permease [Clostridia bacterium]|nr:ABC transporter permease [Clostridia bacterium]